MSNKVFNLGATHLHVLGAMAYVFDASEFTGPFTSVNTVARKIEDPADSTVTESAYVDVSSTYLTGSGSASGDNITMERLSAPNGESDIGQVIRLITTFDDANSNTLVASYDVTLVGETVAS